MGNTRCLAALAAAECVLLSGCAGDGTKTLEDHPRVQGVVESLAADSLTLKVEPGEEALQSSDRIVVFLDKLNGEDTPELAVGDRIAVYYDGQIAESYPAQIHQVYGIVRLDTTQEEVEASVAAFTQITPQQAKAYMEQMPQAIVLDVREEYEYEAGHIPGAVLFPLGTIERGSAAQVIPEQDTMVLVYCRSGSRSKMAANRLVQLGYTQVYEFGGILDWPYEVE